MINLNVEKNKNLIQKYDFFENDYLNFITLKYDNEGNFWNENERKQIIRNYILNHKSYRNIKFIKNEEIEKRYHFKKTIKKDIFYQFKETYKNIPNYINHFQVRKNLEIINNNLIYCKKYGIEIFDIISKRNQSLLNYNEEESNKIICFTTQLLNNNFYVCIGKINSLCELYKIKNEDYIKCRNLKNNILTPENKIILKLNDVNNQEESINYLKFLPENKLLRTGNDSYIKIYDLNKNNKITYELKSENPINHCDINNNILISVGDEININIFDMREKKILYKLNEHYDYGIVIKFNEYNNNYFASGNQDVSCKIWDIRFLKKSIYTLFGNYECIGDLIWMKNNNICFMENSFFGHVFNYNLNCIQNFQFLGFFNGIQYLHSKDSFFFNVQNEFNGDIVCFESIKGKNCLNKFF